VAAGTFVTFAASASGGPFTAIQWYFNSVAIEGASSSTYTVVASSSTAGYYSVYIANAAGGTSSEPGLLTVAYSSSGSGSGASAPVQTGSVPVITYQPQSAYVLSGTMVTFGVSVQSPSALASIQWYFNSIPIRGANGSTYSVLANANTAGVYAAYLTNVGGNGVNTQPASLGAY
jgi:hypothetical protein